MLFAFSGWRIRSGFAVECNYSTLSRAILTTPCRGPLRIGNARKYVNMLMSWGYARRFGFAGDNMIGSARDLLPNIGTGIFTTVQGWTRRWSLHGLALGGDCGFLGKESIE